MYARYRGERERRSLDHDQAEPGAGRAGRSASAGSGRTVRVDRGALAMPGMAIIGRRHIRIGTISHLAPAHPTTVRTGPRVATARPGPSVDMGLLVPTVRNASRRAGGVSRWADRSLARPRSELARCRKWPARSWVKLGRSSAKWPGRRADAVPDARAGGSGAAAGPGVLADDGVEPGRGRCSWHRAGRSRWSAHPGDRKEHQLMGETRDRVIGSVQEMAGKPSPRRSASPKKPAGRPWKPGRRRSKR